MVLSQSNVAKLEDVFLEGRVGEALQVYSIIHEVVGLFDQGHGLFPFHDVNLVFFEKLPYLCCVDLLLELY